MLVLDFHLASQHPFNFLYSQHNKCMLLNSNFVRVWPVVSEFHIFLCASLIWSEYGLSFILMRILFCVWSHEIRWECGKYQRNTIQWYCYYECFKIFFFLKKKIKCFELFKNHRKLKLVLWPNSAEKGNEALSVEPPVTFQLVVKAGRELRSTTLQIDVFLRLISGNSVFKQNLENNNNNTSHKIVFRRKWNEIIDTIHHVCPMVGIQ